MQSSITPEGARAELERRQAARAELARRKVSASFQNKPEEQHQPTFWEKMGPGGEKYLSEQEKKRIVESDPQLMMNAASIAAPFGQAGKLLGQGAGTLARGAANMAGRIGQAGGYSGLESWAKGHGAGEGFGQGALLQGALEGAIPALKGLGHAATTAFKHIPWVEKAREHLGINELKKNIQNVINEHIFKESKKEGGPRSPEQAQQLMKEQYMGTQDQQLPVDIGTLTGEPATSSAYKATKYLPGSETPKKLNFIQQQQNEVERMKLQKSLEEEKNNIANEQKKVEEKKQSILNEANPFRESHKNLNEQLERSLANNHYEPQAKQAGNELLEKLGQGTTNKEESAKKLASMIREKHNERVEESSQFFKHVFQQGGRNKLYEHVDPLITTKLDKEMDIMKRLKGINVKPLYEKFKNDPSIENGHWLKSELGTIVGDLERNMTKSPADRATIANINNVRKTLETDIHDALKRHDNNSNENLLPMYKKGVQLHMEHVEPFRSTPGLREITVKGIETPKNIENIFSTPTDIIKKEKIKTGSVNKIIKDLPEEAKDLILHNKIGAHSHLNDHEKLIKALHKAKNEGFSTYFNPHIKEKIKDVEHKTKNDLENELKIKLNEKRIKSLLSEIKSHESKINNIEKKAQAIEEAPIETTLSNKLLKNLEDNEKKRLEMKPEGGFVPKLSGVAGLTALGIKLPTTSLALAFGGAPMARLLRDPKMLEAYMKKQPLEVRKSLMSKLKELAPRIAAISTQGNE